MTEPPVAYTREERWYRRDENKLCESLAQVEGDRLLKLGDLLGAEVAHRISALIRIRRDEHLEVF